MGFVRADVNAVAPCWAIVTSDAASGHSDLSGFKNVTVACALRNICGAVGPKFTLLTRFGGSRTLDDRVATRTARAAFLEPSYVRVGAKLTAVIG